MNISVIIPVYNAEAFLEKAVESALVFEEVKEVLLVEDASTDHSLSLCNRLIQKDSRIKLYQHADKKNHGAAASRNIGIEKATSEFIAFLDADDYYLLNRFDAEKRVLKDSKIDGVFGALGIEYLSEKGKKEFQEKFKNIQLTTVEYPAEGRDVFEGLLGLTPKRFGTFFHLNTLTVRKTALIKYKLYFNENLRVHQDSDFITKLSYHCYLKSGIIDQAIAVRGIHDNNRITKIIKFSQQYKQRQFLLWGSLYQWAVSVKLPSRYMEKIYLVYRSYDLSLKGGIIKYLSILWEVIKNSKILKTQYRFTYLNR